MLAAADPRLGDPFKIVRAALIKTGHLEFDVDIALNIKAAVLSKP